MLIHRWFANSLLKLLTQTVYSDSKGSISMFQLFDTMMDYLFTEQHWWPENLISMHEIHETSATKQFLLHVAKVIYQGIFSRFVWLVMPHFLQENMISLKSLHFQRLTENPKVISTLFVISKEYRGEPTGNGKQLFVARNHI